MPTNFLDLDNRRLILCKKMCPVSKASAPFETGHISLLHFGVWTLKIKCVHAWEQDTYFRIRGHVQMNTENLTDVICTWPLSLQRVRHWGVTFMTRFGVCSSPSAIQLWH